MADFNPSWADGGPKRAPTISERDLGFGCGEADLELFNYLFNLLDGQVAHLASEAGEVSNGDGDKTVLYRSIEALIAAATGGTPAGYVLENQARARLPIFPEILSADNRINVTSPAAGTVRLPGGVNFLHRGIYQVTTVETDFPTTASTTYHLRWQYDGTSGTFDLIDVADGTYNPGGLPETDAAFDSTYDDMLIARVVCNSSNVATITNLLNADRLALSELLEGTNKTQTSSSTWFYDFQFSMNWARSPKTYSFHLAAGQQSGNVSDNDFIILPLGSRNEIGLPEFQITRYQLAQSVLRDDSNNMLWMHFSAGA